MKNYRGWKLTFSKGSYSAKKNSIRLFGISRVQIERKIDELETEFLKLEKARLKQKSR